MILNNSQIPSTCNFTHNMDIKTWKPGVALMFAIWCDSNKTKQTFNDAIDDNSGWANAVIAEYVDEEEYEEWVGKTAKEIAENHFDDAWYADGKTIPSDYETYMITWNNATFDCVDMRIAVDSNTREILLATMHSD